LRKRYLVRDDVVVEREVSQLARPRRGHFDLGTGYHGDLWLDLDALFLRPALLRPYVRTLADRLRGHQADAVCGPMEGGAFLAQAISVPFYAAGAMQSQAWPAGQCALCASGTPLSGSGE
jgi:orotate phosphoribosyltransferase